ncbi:MAG: tetratricopeptide repeat protein [Planctomycetaceae bacterium]
MESANRLSPADRRLHATLLVRRGRPEDRRQAMDILENLVQIPQQAQARDRVQLASLYEAENRIQPAFEQFTTVARDEQASPIHLAAYVEFLQRNATEQPQFVSRAEIILERLEADPVSAQSAFRLRIRKLKQVEEAAAKTSGIRTAIDAFVTRQIAAKADAQEKRDSFTGLLVLLVREELGDEAVRVARETTVIPKPSAAACLANGLTLVRDSSKVVEAAEPIFRDAQQEAPADAELLFALGNLRYVNGRRDEAVALYRKVLESNPDHKLAINNLALSLAEDPSGLDEALKVITSAIAKLGRDSGLIDTHAVVLLRQKNPVEARKLLEEAVQSQDSEPMYFLHLAAAFHAEGNVDRARRVFQRAVALDAAAAAITPGDRAMFRELEQLFTVPASADMPDKPQT